MFGVVAWSGVTRWLDIDTVTPEPAETMTPTSSGELEPELPTATVNNKNVDTGAESKHTNSSRRQRSDKRRPTEPRSIVEVIDKNGTRRKSIIV